MTEPVKTVRVRPGFRRAAIVLFILLLPVAAHALWDYIEIRRLVREIDAIRAKGEPVTEQEAGHGYKKLSDDEELAGRYLLAAGVLAYPTATAHRGARQPVVEFVAGHATMLDQDAATRLQTAVAQGKEALELADRAVALPFVGFPPGTEYNYRTSEVYALTQLLAMRTAAASLAGDGAGAVASAIASVRARPAQTFFRLPDYDTALVLSFSSPARPELERLLAVLMSQDQPDAIERDVLTGRAEFLARIASAYSGNPRVPGSYRDSRQAGGEWLARLWRPWFTRTVIETLRGWNTLVAASRVPWPDKAGELQKVYDRYAPVQYGRAADGTLRSRRWWIPRAVEGAAMIIPPRSRRDSLALDRASATAIALTLYRRDRGGALPDSLHALVPDYLPAVPQDPASGGPLLLKRDAHAFTIYSVGPDQKDDGGDLTSQLKKVDEQGWGMRQLAGKDVGIRVLLNPPALLPASEEKKP